METISPVYARLVLQAIEQRGIDSAPLFADIALTREELLRGHDWNFARGRQKLARLTAAPTYEFDHAYQLPTDWLATLSGATRSSSSPRSW